MENKDDRDPFEQLDREETEEYEWWQGWLETVDRRQDEQIGTD